MLARLVKTTLPSVHSGAPRMLRFGVSAGHFSTDTPKNAAELALQNILTDTLQATHVNVVDVSGGCGSMYNIEIASNKFEGKKLLEQHRMVNESLKNEISNMHGLTLRTMTTAQYERKNKTP